jgi:hypothetical protein
MITVDIRLAGIYLGGLPFGSKKTAMHLVQEIGSDGGRQDLAQLFRESSYKD